MIKTAKHPRVGNIYYFPERLKNKLALISSYPVTVVEAPSGFGKTTAVREYLNDNIPRNTHIHWHICLGEPPSRVWEGICGLFAGVMLDVAETLKALGPPTIETLADVASVMRTVQAGMKTYLVVDNYQLFDNAIPREIIDAFSVHVCDNLRVIFITQPLPDSKQKFYNTNINNLAEGDFLFDRDNTARMCRMFGIKLPEKELDYLQKVSAGWVAVIRLQAENYRETGSLAQMNDMDSLVETAIWNRLAQDERDFLSVVS
ncbi:MAG: hypothetical protein LBQ36_03565, partial [Synergistaceae bacterium]|nr:hypothetical protein [Synergistaceae bacterium]